MTKPTIYQAKQPELQIEKFFSGPVTGYGMVQGRSGEVKRRFVVDMQGNWTANEGTLNENFVFDDGEKQHRQWHFVRIDDYKFKATAADVTGQATVEQSGNAINMKYVLQIPIDGKRYDISFDDWLFSVDDHVVLNRATMKKFGFTVGSITASFIKK